MFLVVTYLHSITSNFDRRKNSGTLDSKNVKSTTDRNGDDHAETSGENNEDAGKTEDGNAESQASFVDLLV